MRHEEAVALHVAIDHVQIEVGAAVRDRLGQRALEIGAAHDHDVRADLDLTLLAVVLGKVGETAALVVSKHLGLAIQILIGGIHLGRNQRDVGVVLFVEVHGDLQIHVADHVAI